MWFVNSEVSREIDRVVAETPGLELSYGDLSVSLTDHAVTLENVETHLPDGKYFTADVLRISRFDQENPVPHFATVEAIGVSMETTFSNFGSWAAPLLASGFSTVHGSFGMSYEYDAKEKQLKVDELVVKAEDLGDLHLATTLDRLDLDAFRMEKIIGLRMEHAMLTVTDHGMVRAVVHSIAKSFGTSDPVARNQMVTELALMADYAGDSKNPVAEGVLTGLRKFLVKPGTLFLEAKPVEPVPFLACFLGRDIYENMRLMNISATAGSNDDI